MKTETLLWKDAEQKYLEKNPLNNKSFSDICNWLETQGYKIKITKKVR